TAPTGTSPHWRHRRASSNAACINRSSESSIARQCDRLSSPSTGDKQGLQEKAAAQEVRMAHEHDQTNRAGGVGSAADLIPSRPSLRSLQEAAMGCRACRLHRPATQTVFGEGPTHAEVMFVGEQPGDREDLTGEPFVGPAGNLLDQALEQVGIDRTKVYVTNVVKHFKWTPKGKRRIHKRPAADEIAACRPWLDAEIRVVRPTVIVCLGATAAQALLGRQFRVTQQRGRFVD